MNQSGRFILPSTAGSGEHCTGAAQQIIGTRSVSPA